VNIERLFDQRLTYAKGAYALHIIRKQMGDQPFFTAIKNYLADPALAFGTANTDELFKHLQKETPINLIPFKNEWIYGQGYPSYSINWHQIEGTVLIDVVQTTSHPSVPFYHLQLPIQLVDQNNDLHTVYLDQTYEQEYFELTVPYSVKNILIDNELDLVTAANQVIHVKEIQELKIYPNPAQEELHVQLPSTLNKIDYFVIYSPTGQQIKMGIPDLQFGKFSIDVNALANGTYTLELVSANLTVKEIFVVSR
jgi:hypothetical protein